MIPKIVKVMEMEINDKDSENGSGEAAEGRNTVQFV